MIIRVRWHNIKLLIMIKFELIKFVTILFRARRLVFAYGEGLRRETSELGYLQEFLR